MADAPNVESAKAQTNDDDQPFYLNDGCDCPHGCYSRQAFLECVKNGTFRSGRCHAEDMLDSTSDSGQPLCPRNPRAVTRAAWRKTH